MVAAICALTLLSLHSPTKPNAVLLPPVMPDVARISIGSSKAVERRVPVEPPAIFVQAFQRFSDNRLESLAPEKIRARLAANGLNSFAEATDVAKLKRLRTELGVEVLILPVIKDHGKITETSARFKPETTDKNQQRREEESRRRNDPLGRKGEAPEPRFETRDVPGYRTDLELIVIDSVGERRMRLVHRTSTPINAEAEQRHALQVVDRALKFLVQEEP
jgi:hypothetical protein